MAPEIIKSKEISSKSDIWSLGVLIYYMLFKKYPFTENTKDNIDLQIIFEKEIKLIKDDNLNELIKKMFKININDRISWDDYFNHSFFKNEFLYPQFNFKCELHSKNFIYYCKKCIKNICDDCLKEYQSHQIIPFSKIGLNDEEIQEFNNVKYKIYKEIFFVYENNLKFNYKKYYIDILGGINEKLKNILDINIIDLKESSNFIIYEYEITKDKLNELIRILSS